MHIPSAETSPSVEASANPVVKPWNPPKAGIIGGAVAIVLGIGGALSILAAWKLPPFDTPIEETEDAYVKGRTTVISPQASGFVVKVYVQDYQNVKKGDLLAKIDDLTYRQKVEEAKAEVDVAITNLENNDQTIAARTADVNASNAMVASAGAQLQKAQIDVDRANKMANEGSSSQSVRDNALAAFSVARASLDQANAQVVTAQENVKSATTQGKVFAAQIEGARSVQRQAEIDLARTEIRSPEDGQLSEIGVKVGQYVTDGTQLVFLVPQTKWVVANFKEAQTALMAVGQQATFDVDGLMHRRFHGRVEQISPAAGSEFSVLRPDNATGNFIKVPQRISVKIGVDDGQPLDRLRPGMSVEVAVDTGNSSMTSQVH